jgi:hypothetical protein
MGHHTFQALFLWHQLHFVYRPLTYQLVDDNNKLIGNLTHWALILQEYNLRLFTDLVLHIRMQIPCRGDPSLPLKIS